MSNNPEEDLLNHARQHHERILALRENNLKSDAAKKNYISKRATLREEERKLAEKDKLVRDLEWQAEDAQAQLNANELNYSRRQSYSRIKCAKTIKEAKAVYKATKEEAVRKLEDKNGRLLEKYSATSRSMSEELKRLDSECADAYQDVWNFQEIVSLEKGNLRALDQEIHNITEQRKSIILDISRYMTEVVDRLEPEKSRMLDNLVEEVKRKEAELQAAAAATAPVASSDDNICHLCYGDFGSVECGRRMKHTHNIGVNNGGCGTDACETCVKNWPLHCAFCRGETNAFSWDVAGEAEPNDDDSGGGDSDDFSDFNGDDFSSDSYSYSD